MNDNNLKGFWGRRKRRTKETFCLTVEYNRSSSTSPVLLVKAGGRPVGTSLLTRVGDNILKGTITMKCRKELSVSMKYFMMGVLHLFILFINLTG